MGIYIVFMIKKRKLTKEIEKFRYYEKATQIVPSSTFYMTLHSSVKF